MSYVKELPSHAKCCASRLDRLRDEYDRGMKMLAFEEARMERDGKEPRPRRIQEIETFISKRRYELAEAEQKALEAMRASPGRAPTGPQPLTCAAPPPPRRRWSS